MSGQFYEAGFFMELTMHRQGKDRLVSVALCTYNGVRFIKQQLDSLLAQTHQNIEIIVADDGSTDGTVAILLQYAAADSRLRVLANPVNLGFRKNFEQVISLCSGDYIAPCDQDDIWLPEKLEILLDSIGTHQMVYCDCEFVDAIGESFGLYVSDRMSLQDIQHPLMLMMHNCVSGHAMVFRREMLECALPFPSGFEYHDWWLAAVAAARGGVVYCDRALVKYRLHARNLTDMLGLRFENKTKKMVGRKYRNLHEAGSRLDSLASIEGPYQELVARLGRLWRARESQWLSIELACLLTQHREKFQALRNTERKRSFFHYSNYVLGLKIKRIANKKEYVE